MRLSKLISQFGNAGVMFVLIVAVVIVIITLIPAETSPITKEGCVVGEKPATPEILRLPAIKNQFDAPRLGQPSDLSIGGPDPNEMADYQLIRSKVPTARQSTPAGWTFLGGTEKSEVEHTINIGEVPEKPGYDLYYPSEWGEMDIEIGRVYIRGEGMLIFVSNDPNMVVEKDGKTIYMAEVYQDVRILNDPNKKYETEDLFLCFQDQELTAPQLTIPEQSNSPDQQQLQLQWIYMKGGSYWGVHCKPAVYLYPPKKMFVNVKVKPSGYLTYTDPRYDDLHGWGVMANPSGLLDVIDPAKGGLAQSYNYLYFESKIRDEVIRKPSNGWVVESRDQLTVDNGQGELWFYPLELKFNEILPQLGLNQAQTKDFIEYWRKALPYSPYYFIGVIDQDNVDQIEQLEITPKPDKVNRVRIYFERLDEMRNVNTPVLADNSQPETENSFSVVEWGGMVKNDPKHPFTCSQ